MKMLKSLSSGKMTRRIKTISWQYHWYLCR